MPKFDKELDDIFGEAARSMKGDPNEAENRRIIMFIQGEYRATCVEDLRPKHKAPKKHKKKHGLRLIKGGE